MTAPATRRERLRANTALEIKQAARHRLMTDGAATISLRGIARDLGMAPAALYRYFPSLSELISDMLADLFTELNTTMENAITAHAPGHTMERLYAASHAFREWSIQHRREFALMFGNSLLSGELPEKPGEQQEHPALHQAGIQFRQTFVVLFNELWEQKPFPVPATRALPTELRQQLESYRADLGIGMPMGAIYVFVSCWTQLYGLVSMEVYGQLCFAAGEGAAMFDTRLKELTRLLGRE